MQRPAEAGSGGLGRHDLRVLLIPLACGFALRLLRLGHHGLFKDEGYSWAFSELGWSRMLPESIESFHPPLYYLVLKITRLVLPDTEVALRLPSVFFSLAGLLALGLTARALAGTRTAALAIWLGAISSFEICYAQDARMYTMLGFLWFLSAALLLWAWERPRVFVAWGVSAVLLAWTHLYGAVTASIELAIVVGWTLRRLRGKRPQRRGSMSERSEDGRSEPGWILAGSTLALVGVGMLGWNFRGHVAMEGGGGAWIPRLIDPGGLLALITVGLTAARGHFLDGSHLVPERLGSVPYGVWGVIGATLTLPAIFGWMRAVRGDGRMRRAAWISACVTTLPVAIAFIHARTQGLNTWAYKPFLGVAAMVYLWSAIGWMRWVEGPDTSSHSATKPGWRWLGVAKSGRLFGVATVLGAVALVSLVPYYARWERWPVADAYRSLPGTLVAGETLVLDAASQAWVAFFYLPAHAQRSQDRIWTTESGGGWVNRKDALAARVQPASCADLAAASPAGVRIIDAAKTDRRSADAIAGELSRCLAPPTPIRYWDEGGWRSYGAAGGGGPALGRATRFSGSSLPADPDPSRSQGGSGAGYVAGKDPELYSDTTLVVADTVQVTVPPTCLVAYPAGDPPADGWPVFVLLHGYGTNKEDFRELAQVVAINGAAAISVDAPQELGDGRRSWGPDIADTHAYIQEQIAALKADPRLDFSPTHVGGFSQGGIRSALLVAYYPEIYGGALSVSPSGGKLPGKPTATTTHHPVWLVYGSTDQPEILDNADALTDYWTRWGQPHQEFAHPGGHRFPGDWQQVLGAGARWIVAECNTDTPD